MREYNFEGQLLDGKRFSERKLEMVNFKHTKLRNANFYRATLDFTLFDFACVDETNFLAAHALDGVSFYGVQGHKTHFTHASFNHACFMKSALSQACFREASLKRVSFCEASLVKCSFKDADLRKANFTSAYLRNVDFSGARLENAEFFNAQLIDPIGLHSSEEWMEWYFEEKEEGHEVFANFLEGMFDEYFPGQTLKLHPTATLDTDRRNLFGVGLDFGTLEFISNRFHPNNLWRCLIPKTAQVVVPYGTDGYGRTNCLRLIEPVKGEFHE